MKGLSQTVFVMKCNQCQTEIAENALVCFRCGSPTTESLKIQVPIASRRKTVMTPVLLGIVFVAVTGFFINQAFQGMQTPPIVWLMLTTAGMLLLYRLWLR